MHQQLNLKTNILKSAIATSIALTVSSVSYADTNADTQYKPNDFEAINIQNISGLVDANKIKSTEAPLGYEVENPVVDPVLSIEDAKKKIANANAEIEKAKADIANAKAKIQNTQAKPKIVTLENGVSLVEDVEATRQAAIKAGVIKPNASDKAPLVDETPNKEVDITIDETTTTVEVPASPLVKDISITKGQPETAEESKTPAVDTSPVTGSTDNTDGNNSTIDGFNSDSYRGTVNLSQYASAVNSAQWSQDMKTNTAMTIKLQALLDWNHASPGPLDGGWGGNSRKALKNFQAMKGISPSGRMNQATWDALTKNVPATRPVLFNYTITPADVNYRFTTIPGNYEQKAKLPALNYNNVPEMLAERFHMSVGYLKKLNPNKKFVAGETLAVFNPSKNLRSTITRVVANKKAETLYAYNSKNQLVATYPTTVGSSATPSPHGTFRIINRVKKPHYRATVEREGEAKQVYMLKPGPNSPVGIVWLGLSKPSYGIHGSPIPEGISRQASHGCIRLTNWDALEVYANIKTGAKVELK